MKKKKKKTFMDELPRLNRIAGQIDGVRKMVEADRYCSDILIQLRAIRAAVKVVEVQILQKQMQACVEDFYENPAEREQKMEELKRLYDRFDS